jgi:hypothetical protein
MTDYRVQDAIKHIEDAMISVEEIYSALKRLAHSLRYNQHLDDKDAVQNSIKKLTDVVFDPMFIELAYGDYPPNDHHVGDLGTLCLESLNISLKVVKALHKESIFTVGQLVLLTEMTLLKMPQLGKQQLKNIKSALKDKGLRLGMKIKE